MSGQQESLLAAALEYHGRGWCVIPVRYREKRPVNSGWQDLRLDEDDIRREFAVQRNIGVLLGEPSGGLVDVDLDVPEAIVVARHLLPETARFGHQSNPDSHYFYEVVT